MAAAEHDGSSHTFSGTWESLENYRCPTWFRDAKLGIFLHWGPSSVPAVDDWYGRSMYIQGHPAYEYHVKNFGHPSEFGFKDLIHHWKAEKFDADRLVKVFGKAGAGYIVPVATFHDNYDLWDSKYQKWNALNMGPKKDICALWKNAALKNGMRFGVSTHMDRVPSWFNTSRGSDSTGPMAGIPYDGNDIANSDLYGPVNDEGMDWPYLPKNASTEWRKTWYRRTMDLIDSYQPDLLYFDGGIPYVDVGLDLVAHFYNENQRLHDGRLEAVLNLKKTKVSGAYHEGMCVQDLERSMLEGIKPEPWQTDTSIGPWFCRRDSTYESPKSIINMFIDIVAKNGNLLLNIPLLADGTLDDEAASILSVLSSWVAVNGEAIFGTRPWHVFGEGPTSVTQEYSETIKETYTSKDFRFTTKGKTLYAFCMEKPDDDIRIQSLSSNESSMRISSVELLGYAGEVDWNQSASGLSVSMPRGFDSDYACALKIAPR